MNNNYCNHGKSFIKVPFDYSDEDFCCSHDEVLRITPHSNKEPYYFCHLCQKIIPDNMVSDKACIVDCCEDNISMRLKKLYDAEKKNASSLQKKKTIF